MIWTPALILQTWQRQKVRILSATIRVHSHSAIHPVWPLTSSPAVPQSESDPCPEEATPLPACRYSHLVSSSGTISVLSAQTSPVVKCAKTNEKTSTEREREEWEHPYETTSTPRSALPHNPSGCWATWREGWGEIRPVWQTSSPIGQGHLETGISQP